MALQIDVTWVDVVPKGAGGTMTLNLKCWIEGDDSKTDTPVLDIDKSAYIKKGVEDVTTQQLVNRATTEIGEAFQAEIELYKNNASIAQRKAVIEGMVNITALENALKG